MEILNKKCPKCGKPMFCIGGGYAVDPNSLPVACRCRDKKCGYQEPHFDEVKEKEEGLRKVNENRKENARRNKELLL